MIRLFHISLIVILLFSCSGIRNESEMFEILNSEPYKVTKVVSGFSFTAKYLPSSFLAWKELKITENIDNTTFLELNNSYKESHTILFNIGPDLKENSIDITKYQVSEYEEYKKRILALNFDIEEYIYLERDGEKIYPILSNFENHHGIRPDRTIYLVFPRSQEEMRGFQLVFEDALFETGIHHFAFDEEVLSLPELKFISS